MRIKATLLLGAFLVLFSSCLFSQNTVGVLSFDGAQAFPGYNLLYPFNQGSVYLLDNCGRVVHSWPDTAGVVPGNTVYLNPDGSILKTKRDLVLSDDPIAIGGSQGEFLEIRDWDNNVTWSYKLNDSTARLHHDAVPMANGNVLAIAWERLTGPQAIALGRDTSLLKDGELWPDMILEIEPLANNGFNIVWEWHAKDHLIQDYDASAPDFGVVGDHPERIDLNYVGVDPGEADWLHFNGMDYNDELDLIAISVPEFNEIWIIDHSTTTAESASSSGGQAGKGGDLLFRWGNPLAYDAGDSTDIQLWYQHNVHWINDEIPTSNPNYNKLMLFSNRHPGDSSSVQIINPTFDAQTSTFGFSNGTFEPAAPDYIYKSDEIYSNILSSGQLLANGNILIGVGRPGYSREITPTGGVVWEYENPIVQGNAATQGDVPSLSSNMMFRMKRYSMGYAAFANRTLSPGSVLEINGDTALCAQLALSLPLETGPNWTLYPNPNSGTFRIGRQSPAPAELKVMDLIGRVQHTEVVRGFEPEITLPTLPAGMYLVEMEGKSSRILLK